MIQETMFSYYGLLKIPGYQIFENLRDPGKGGGGLLTAVLCSLDPVLIASHDDVEILVVQIEINKVKIRLINAYGPQEDEEPNKTLLFWQSIEAEIIKCENEGCYILMEKSFSI